MSKVLANASAADRPATDFYPTPPEVTKALIDWANWDRERVIWEPAAGQGHMVRVFEQNGYKVRAQDLYTYDQKDFLQSEELHGDIIVTNPPFNRSEEFIRHAARLRPQGFAFLLKSQYWHASRRKKLFDEIPPVAVLPLTWRPDFLMGTKGGAPTMEVLWTVWAPRSTQTIYLPLSKPNTEAT